MRLKNILADVILSGNAEQLLTSVAEAFDEVTERNNCCSATSEAEALRRNAPLNEVARVIYAARNDYRKQTK